jgi:hypothetical protein
MQVTRSLKRLSYINMYVSADALVWKKFFELLYNAFLKESEQNFPFGLDED